MPAAPGAAWAVAGAARATAASRTVTRMDGTLDSRRHGDRAQVGPGALAGGARAPSGQAHRAGIRGAGRRGRGGAGAPLAGEADAHREVRARTRAGGGGAAAERGPVRLVV